MELVDGEVVEAPTPSWRHQRLVKTLLVALETWARTVEGFTVGHAPCDIRFGPGRILQPDLFVMAGAISDAQEGPIDRIPLLCVEVLPRDVGDEHLTKRALYAEAGVPECWLVNWDGIVERRFGERLEGQEMLNGALASPLLPGFDFDLAELAPV
ncbi:MAG: Uma2 family endonuclease [Myxococcales bacterium]|nr:Uma2 family endonuclease [Myxococcales bacterium]MCB9537690.1 Uma2 family endonuclease [Myxococcales bacterium]